MDFEPTWKSGQRESDLKREVASISFRCEAGDSDGNEGEFIRVRTAAANLRKRKEHRMTRNVAEAFVHREGTDCGDGEPRREQWRLAQRLTQRLYDIASKG